MTTRSGVTYGNSGGEGGAGTFYRLASDGTPIALHQYLVDDVAGFLAVVRTPDGALVGLVKFLGYAFVGGAVIRLDGHGSLQLLHVFKSLTDGDEGSLLQARDGTFVGTTASGGRLDQGTIFRIAADGSFTTIHEFVNSDGAAPNGLVQAADGQFYGTTNGGGTFGMGVVFRIASDGTFAVVHHFAGGPDDGAYPTASVVQASDGRFYGTTVLGGAFGRGTVFRMTPAGVVTVLQPFTFKNPSFYFYRIPALVQARDGALYGITPAMPACLGSEECWFESPATFFRLTLDGQFTVIRELDIDFAASPQSTLRQAADGNFYATSGGSVVRLMADGSFVEPAPIRTGPAPLLEGTDGWLYGAATLAGGVTDIFRLDPRSGLTTTGFVDRTAPAGVVSQYRVTAVFPNGQAFASALMSVPWLTPASRTPTVTTAVDYDGDGRSDVAVYRASTGQWLVHRSSDGALADPVWGSPDLQDRPVPRDYDGDGKADPAVYRQATGEWLIRPSTDGTLLQIEWGAPALGDLPVPADYDGDGMADLAVYRTTSGAWLILLSATRVLSQVAWGAPALGDTPVPADYDGDGRVDLAVYRQSTGEWLLLGSSSGTPQQVSWGAPALGDVPVPADYDGEGRADLAVYRALTGEWFIRRSSDGATVSYDWGAPSRADAVLPY